jgi:hypothetical protein
MGRSLLSQLFETHSEQEAEEICNAALATTAYKVRMRVISSIPVVLPIVLSLASFSAIKLYQPGTLVRVVLALAVILSIFLGIRLIFPLNDKLVDLAIAKELARRGKRPAL